MLDLTIEVTDLDDVIDDYDKIQVHRVSADDADLLDDDSEISGVSTRISLVAGTTLYSYEDDTGSDSYWYAIRYYNSSTEAVGPFSDLTQGGASSTIKRLRDMIDDNGTTKAFDNDDLREILTRNSDDDTDTELKKSSVECLKMLLASAARRADYVQGNTKVDFSTVFDHIKHLLEMYQGEVSQDTGSGVPRIGKRIHPTYEDDD